MPVGFEGQPRSLPATGAEAAASAISTAAKPGAPPPLPAATTVPPQLLDHPRYRVLRALGQGGMGAVYLAEHRIMRRLVALKVVLPEFVSHPQALERFHREIRVAARLSHPNIVAAHDAEQAGDTHFLVMQYVEGQTLADLLARGGPVPASEACEYIRQTALGLQHAHEQGLVHRDIKPHNLMLAVAPALCLVKILDFGLARFASEPEAGGNLTRSRVVMGTPDYMAPEQADDPRTADIRADLYSLGCTFFHLLTGRIPFPAESVHLKLIAHRRQPPPLDGLPTELAAILARLLAKRPEDRYQTPQEVVAALTPLSAPPVPPGTGPQLNTSVTPQIPAANPPPLPVFSNTTPLARRLRRRVLLAWLALTVLLEAAHIFWLIRARSPASNARPATSDGAVDSEHADGSVPAKPANGDNRMQLLVVSGSTGTFTLTFNGATTAPLPVRCDLSMILNALNKLSTISRGGFGLTARTVREGVYNIHFGIRFDANPALERPPPLMTATSVGGAVVLIQKWAPELESTVAVGIWQGSGTTVTLNTKGPHGFVPGQYVVVSYLYMPGLNGTFPVTSVPTTTSLTYTGLAEGEVVSSSGGVVHAAPGKHFNEVQNITVKASSGAFSITFTGVAANGQLLTATTAPVAFNASAANVQAALNALPNIGGVGGFVTVTQSGNVYSVMFQGTLSKKSMPLLFTNFPGGVISVVAVTKGA